MPRSGRFLFLKMALRFFTIPVRAPAEAERELNAFLASHRVLTVERRFVDAGENSLWAICVDFLAGAPAEEAGARVRENKIDYKQVLTPAQFDVFARLRDVRRALAEKEGVPIYAVFTNEQLAEMVKSRATSKAALGRINGVGEARVEKYAGAILAVLAAARPEPDAAGGSQPDGG